MAKEFAVVGNRIFRLSSVIKLSKSKDGTVYLYLEDDNFITIKADNPAAARVWAWFAARAESIAINPAEDVTEF